jgi:hypothetical protein
MSESIVEENDWPPTDGETGWVNVPTPIGDAAYADTRLASSAEISTIHERLDEIDDDLAAFTKFLGAELAALRESLGELDSDITAITKFLGEAAPLLAMGLKYATSSKTDKVRAALGLKNG